MVDNAVYRLQRILDNPRYEGFGFTDGRSLRGKTSLISDFMPENLKDSGRNWQAPRLSKIWVPQAVEGKVRPFNDFPCVAMQIPAFSERAVEALSEFLVPNGELLPLVSSLGKYYAYNTTTVAAVLDLDRSKAEWFTGAERINALEITEYVFDPTRLTGLSIFRIVEFCPAVYVTQSFMDRIHKAGLKGFDCPKLWPH